MVKLDTEHVQCPVDGLVDDLFQLAGPMDLAESAALIAAAANGKDLIDDAGREFHSGPGN